MTTPMWHDQRDREQVVLIAFWSYRQPDVKRYRLTGLAFRCQGHLTRLLILGHNHIFGTDEIKHFKFGVQINTNEY